MNAGLPTTAAGRWAFAVVWALVVLGLSSDAFGGAQTGRWLRFALEGLWPEASGAEIKSLHRFVRSAAHVTEYFVFAILLSRAFVTRPMTPVRAAVSAVVAAAAFALADEARQGLTTTRVPDLRDSLLDALGAVVGGWIWLRLR